jgi:hypothetical protein
MSARQRYQLALRIDRAIQCRILFSLPRDVSRNEGHAPPHSCAVIDCCPVAKPACPPSLSCGHPLSSADIHLYPTASVTCNGAKWRHRRLRRPRRSLTLSDGTCLDAAPGVRATAGGFVRLRSRPVPYRGTRRASAVASTKYHLRLPRPTRARANAPRSLLLTVQSTKHHPRLPRPTRAPLCTPVIALNRSKRLTVCDDMRSSRQWAARSVPPRLELTNSDCFRRCSVWWLFIVAAPQRSNRDSCSTAT